MEEFKKLVDLIAKLRHPQEGCPWDLKQTHQSLYPLMIDEVYEMIEAVDEGDPNHIREELGDILLHILLQCQIADDEGQFNVVEVMGELTEKLIRRHPHVFAEVEVKNSEEVVANWVQIKEKEGKKHTLEKLPAGTPALVGVSRLIKRDKTLQISRDQALKTLEDQLKNLQDDPCTKEEVGELFFSLSQLATSLNVYPEEALRSKIQNVLISERE